MHKVETINSLNEDGVFFIEAWFRNTRGMDFGARIGVLAMQETQHTSYQYSYYQGHISLMSFSQIK